MDALREFEINHPNLAHGIRVGIVVIMVLAVVIGAVVKLGPNALKAYSARTAAAVVNTAVTAAPVATQAPVAALATSAPDPAATAVPVATQAPVAAPAVQPLAVIQQVDSGQAVMPDRANSAATELTGVDQRSAVAAAMGGNVDASTVSYIQYFHADKASLQVKDATGAVIYSHTFDKGWLATIAVCPGTSWSITGLGFNPDQGNFNIWPAVFAVPSNVDITTAGMYLIWKYQGTSGDANIDAAAATYWNLPAGRKGDDPTVNAVFIDCSGKETVVAGK